MHLPQPPYAPAYLFPLVALFSWCLRLSGRRAAIPPEHVLAILALTALLVAWCLRVPWRVRHLSDAELAAAYSRACRDEAMAAGGASTGLRLWLPYGLPWESWDASERVTMLWAEVSRRASARGGRQVGTT